MLSVSRYLPLMLTADEKYLPRSDMDVTIVLKALANERRLQILEWLKDPRAHFRPQVTSSTMASAVF